MLHLLGNLARAGCPARSPAALIALACLSMLVAPHGSAQFIEFAQVYTPVGVSTDDDGHIYVSHDNVSETLVTKYRHDGTVVGSVQIGGFFDIGALGSLARIPSSATLLHLLSDGRILAIDPNTLAVAPLLDIRELAVDATAVYDVFTGTVSSFGGAIQTSLSTFGDLAIREHSGRTDLYVTGLSQAQTFPFLMRVRVENDAITDAHVLLSSAAETVTDSLQAQRLTRGVAVNPQGVVLTSLPYVLVDEDGNPTAERAHDVLVAIPDSFDPADGIDQEEVPRLVLGGGTDVYSQGMTADAAGRFYIATNSVGTSALGVPGEGALVVLADERVAAVLSLGRALTSFRDVAVSEQDGRVYVSMELFSVDPALDLVVTVHRAHLTGTEQIDPPDRPVIGRAAPNPFSTSTTVRIFAKSTQHVRVELIDLLGRRLGILLDDVVTAGNEVPVVVDGGGLPSGAYFVRVVGETFGESVGIVVAR